MFRYLIHLLYRIICIFIKQHFRYAIWWAQANAIYKDILNVNGSPRICEDNKKQSKTTFLGAILLKELQNFILCIIHVWSLFCSVGIYVRLHSLPIFWKTRLSFLCAFLFSVCSIFWIGKRLKNIWLIIHFYFFLTL